MEQETEPASETFKRDINLALSRSLPARRRHPAELAERSLLLTETYSSLAPLLNVQKERGCRTDGISARASCFRCISPLVAGPAEKKRACQEVAKQLKPNTSTKKGENKTQPGHAVCEVSTVRV